MTTLLTFATIIAWAALVLSIITVALHVYWMRTDPMYQVFGSLSLSVPAAMVVAVAWLIAWWLTP